MYPIRKKKLNEMVGCYQITSLTDLKNCDPTQIKLDYLLLRSAKIINLTLRSAKCPMKIMYSNINLNSTHSNCTEYDG